MSSGARSSWDTPAKAELSALLARLFAAELDSDLYDRLCMAGSPRLSWFEPTVLALPRAQALELLAVEYCRLFVGPQALCPPYASAQRGEAMLGGRARTHLEAFMAAHGVFVPLAEWRIASPDHIAVELAVLGRLYSEGFSAAVIGEFLSRHLLPWVPGFLVDVRSCAHYQLYQLAAKFGSALLRDESSSGAMET